MASITTGHVRIVPLAQTTARTVLRGLTVHENSSRRQAQKRFPILGECQDGCGKPAIERHHIDGNPFNNDASNIKFLCRRCHMKEDGRLSKPIRTLRPCINCGEKTLVLSRQRCHACYNYLWRTGNDRQVNVLEPWHD